MKDTETLKQIDGWEIAFSQEGNCIVFNTIDYHPRPLRLGEDDLWDLLDKVTRPDNDDTLPLFERPDMTH